MTSPGRTILVDGGAGFIGWHLYETAVNRGHRVLCLASLVTGAETNVWHLRDRPGFTALEGAMRVGDAL